MATFDLPILGMGTVPDTTGDVWLAPVSTELSLASAPGNEMCMVMPAAATISADTGFYGRFTVPQNYVGTPVLVIRGILDGAGGGNVLAFGVQLGARADNESYDLALGSQNIASATDSRADEDIYEETISIADTLAVGDDVNYFFFVDDSVHTYTGKFLLTGLFFRYNNA